MQSPVTSFLVGCIISITTFQFSEIYDSPSFCSSSSTDKICNIDYLNTDRKIDYQSFKVEQYIKEFNWLCFNHLDQGFKCKICEFFPHSGVGHLKTKFSQEVLKSSGHHRPGTLSIHEESIKHKKPMKQYEGYCKFFVPRSFQYLACFNHYVLNKISRYIAYRCSTCLLRGSRRESNLHQQTSCFMASFLLLQKEQTQIDPFFNL